MQLVPVCDAWAQVSCALTHRCALLGSLRGELLTGGLSSSRLTGSLLSMMKKTMG